MKPCFLINLVGVILLTTFSGKAEAFTRYNLCARWELKYQDLEDSGDFLSVPTGTSGKTYVSIPNVLYTLNQGSKVVRKGRLGPDGCVEVMNLTPGDPVTEYSFRVWYEVADSEGRNVNILHPDAETWGTSAQIYRELKIHVRSRETWVPTVTLDIPFSPFSRALPVMAHLLQRADILGWPPNGHITIAINNPHKCDGTYSVHTSKYFLFQSVCFFNKDKDTNLYDWGEVAARKTSIAHEMGHAIANMRGGPRKGDYTGDLADGARFNDPNSHCWKKKGNHAFCTREWVGAAAKEGFAHFIAAATFNQRSSTDGVFNYYNSKRWDINNSKVDRFAPTPLTPDSNDQWGGYTDTYCRAPSKFKHLGSEGDWLNFFWGLWTQGGSNRFDIGEIEDVWADTPGDDNRTFCVPRTTLASPYGPTPEDGYKSGWTCKDKYWAWKSRATHTETRYFGIGRTTVVVPDQMILSRKHDRGKDYWSVLKSVQDTHNTTKSTFFNQTALNSKIVY